jgi:hypothetical protein
MSCLKKEELLRNERRSLYTQMYQRRLSTPYRSISRESGELISEPPRLYLVGELKADPNLVEREAK